MGGACTGAARFLERAAPAAVAGDASAILKEIWRAISKRDRDKDDRDQFLLRLRNKANGCFALNPDMVRVETPLASKTWICGYCGSVSFMNIRNVCSRWRCGGDLRLADYSALSDNHYRRLYESDDLPFSYVTEEHTDQIESGEAQRRQMRFKSGEVNLLSSSTTFESGGDWGELDATLLRNVSLEAFNYTQQVRRTGWRAGALGFALTYCRAQLSWLALLRGS